MRWKHSWMRWAWLAVLVLVVPVAGREVPVTAPEAVGLSAKKVDALSGYMQSLVDEGHVAGGVTMLLYRDAIVHHAAVGWADREAEKPMARDAIFRIASMTKPITSVAVMMLVDEGTIGLDDPVSAYIPEFKEMRVLVDRDVPDVDSPKTEPAKRPITIRHLLTHTSGLGYEFTPGVGPFFRKHHVASGICLSDATLEENMRRLAKMPLLFHPGEDMVYGMSVDVLGRVVEVASGMPFERFVAQRLCTPLGMRDTFFRVPESKRDRLVAATTAVETCLRTMKPHEVLMHDMGGPTVMISSDYVTSSEHAYISGGGGLCSTAADYMRFCRMLHNDGELDGKRLLREQTVRMMRTDQVAPIVGGGPRNFGFGFGITPPPGEDHDGPPVPKGLIGSYSWSGFWSTHFRIAPRGDFIVIIMMQQAWNGDATTQWQQRFVNLVAEAVEP